LKNKNDKFKKNKRTLSQILGISGDVETTQNWKALSRDHPRSRDVQNTTTYSCDKKPWNDRRKSNQFSKSISKTRSLDVNKSRSRNNRRKSRSNSSHRRTRTGGLLLKKPKTYWNNPLDFSHKKKFPK
jgi:hypothetical protein